MNISVIIPTLNEASNISRTIKFIAKYGGERILEIIVVDGGSSDESVRLAEMSGAKVFCTPIKGRASQMAKGADESTGEILYFVHADTLPPPSFANDICAAVRKGHQMGNFRYDFDSPSTLLKINAYFTRFRSFFTQGGDRTFFIRREIYFRLGGYNPSLEIMEEYDFLQRALRAGYDFVVINAVKKEELKV